MKTILQLATLAVLFVVAPTWTYAAEDIEIVTKERAKALGLEIRSKAAGPDAVRIELEFPIQGELKDYHRVALEMHDGERLLATSTLKEEESKPGRIVVSFAADRAKLDQFTLKVVTQHGPRDRRGHVIQVKNFVELDKLGAKKDQANADTIDARFKKFDVKAGTLTLQLETGKDQTYPLANKNIQAAGAFGSVFELSELYEGVRVHAILKGNKEVAAIRVIHPTVKTRLLTIDAEKNAIQVQDWPIAGPGPTWLDLVNKPNVIVNGKKIELRDLPKRPLNIVATLTMSITKPKEVLGLEIE